MKRNLSNLILIAGLLVGLCLLAYPSFSDYWNSLHQSHAISSYEEQVEELIETDFRQMWEAAASYNARILERDNIYSLSDEEKADYLALLDIGGNGIMGYITIPSIDVYLPIYHGTEKSVLQIAVGHLDWTSLPVGGEGTHCVLSGHRGLPGAKLFTALDQLQMGDIFTLSVLGEKLTYQVDQIETVLPEETEELLIQEGEDLCTLVTCTPYGVNTHRLLVRGCRIETEEEPEVVYLTSDAVVVEAETVTIAVAIPLFIAAFAFLFLRKQEDLEMIEEEYENAKK